MSLIEAKLAQLAERYDDMAGSMKALVETGAELSSEERNLLWIAYEKVGEARRSTYKVILSIEQKTQGVEQAIAKEYREKIEMELIAICREVVVILSLT